MNSLMSFVFLVALLASGYFLIRLIIATVRKQPTDSFKKKLIASVLAAVVALVGFNVTRSPEQIAAHKEKVEAEHKAAEEKKLADEKAAEEKRLANEKAAEEKRLAEQKAAEEKRIADEKAAEEKRITDAKAAEQKAQEEARKKAEREAAEERRASLLESGVQLSYTIEKLAEHKYKVSGTTNLPNGMKLSIGLASSKFNGDAKIQVKDGLFEATFGGKTDKLVPGEYELSIISVVSSLQPKDIQPILGRNGANLFGTGVVEGEIFSGEKQIVLTDMVYLP